MPDFIVKILTDKNSGNSTRVTADSESQAKEEARKEFLKIYKDGGFRITEVRKA